MDQHNLFQGIRDQYSRFGKIYALGSFTNTNLDEMEEETVQLKPIPSTNEMWSTLYKDFNYGQMYSENKFKEDQLMYQTSNWQARRVLSDIYSNHQFSVAAEGAEFLDGIGNKLPEHTLRLIEAVDDQYHIYLIIEAGVAVIEAKSNILRGIPEDQFNDDVFTFDDSGRVIVNESGYTKLALSLAKQYFSVNIDDSEVLDMTGMKQVGGSFKDIGKKAGRDNHDRLYMVVQTSHDWN